MFERVLAGDIRPGDRVARTRTAEFREVSAVRHTPVAVRIDYLGTGGHDRPRQDAKWWKASGAILEGSR